MPLSFLFFIKVKVRNLVEQELCLPITAHFNVGFYLVFLQNISILIYLIAIQSN
jgi:hypothetical protein